MGSCHSRPWTDEEPVTPVSKRHFSAWSRGRDGASSNHPASESRHRNKEMADRGPGMEHATRMETKPQESSSKAAPAGSSGGREDAGFLPGSIPASPAAMDAKDESVDLSAITGRSIGTSAGSNLYAAPSVEPLQFRAPLVAPVPSEFAPAPAVLTAELSRLLPHNMSAEELASAGGDRGLSMLIARMGGSMHGGLQSALLGGGPIMPGAMYGGSLHGGLMNTGSLHGGGGRNSSVALRAMQAAKMRATKPALERHNVQVLGHGSELLVFSHAFGHNHTVWTSVLESFDKSKYRIVLYDLNGALGSDYDAFDFQRYSTLHGFAEDLLLMLRELGVDGSSWSPQCTFVGHQHSGMMGLLASVECPRAFKRIIMIGSTPRLLDAPGYEGGFALPDLDQVFGIMQGNFKTWSKGYAPVLNADDIHAASVRDFTRPLFLLRPDVAFSNLKTAFACDLRDVLPKVGVQVHMLFLAKDPTVPQSAIQFMLQAIPNAYAEILPLDSFHARPDVVAAGVQRHLSMPLRDVQGASAPAIGGASQNTPAPAHPEGGEPHPQEQWPVIGAEGSSGHVHPQMEVDII